MNYGAWPWSPTSGSWQLPPDSLPSQALWCHEEEAGATALKETKMEAQMKCLGGDIPK